MFVAAWETRRIERGPVPFSFHSRSMSMTILATAYAVRLWISDKVSPFAEGIMVGGYEVSTRGKNWCRISGAAGEGWSTSGSALSGVCNGRMDDRPNRAVPYHSPIPLSQRMGRSNISERGLMVSRQR